MKKLRVLSKLLGKKINMDRKKSVVHQKATPIFESGCQPLSITNEMKTEIVNNPHKYQNLDARVRMGKFYTDEELKEYHEKSLKRRLP